MDKATFTLGRRSALDGFRGIAILFVVCCHVGSMLMPSSAFKLFPVGEIGVPMFFALSGFLITSLLLEEYRKTGTIALGAFYKRRVLRLWPALYLLLLGATVFSVLDHINAALILKGDFFVAIYQSNWAWINNWPVPFGLDHTWSLGVEEQFYTVWPLVLIGLLKLRRTWLVPATAGALLVASVTWQTHLWVTTHNAVSVSVGTPACVCQLMIGVLLASALHYGWNPSLLFTRCAGMLGAAYLLVYAQFSGGWNIIYLGYFPSAIAASAVILATLQPGVLNTSLSVRPLRWLGKISYSLYLWHVFVFEVIVVNFPRLATAERVSIGLAITFTMAIASTYLVEQPILRLKHREKVPPIAGSYWMRSAV